MPFDTVAFLGHAFQQRHDEPANRVHVLMFNVKVKMLVEFVQQKVAAHEDDAFLLDFIGNGFALALEFVHNFADDFFHEVFHGNQAGGATVFVQDDGDLGTGFAEADEHIFQRKRLEDEERLAFRGDVAQVEGGLRFGGFVARQVFDVENADDGIQRAFVHGIAGIAGFADERDDFAVCGVRGNADDAGARRHNHADSPLGEVEDVFQEELFGFFKDAFALFDDVFKFFDGHQAFVGAGSGNTQRAGDNGAQCVEHKDERLEEQFRQAHGPDKLEHGALGGLQC